MKAIEIRNMEWRTGRREENYNMETPALGSFPVPSY
jgi:hypothetical protein